MIEGNRGELALLHKVICLPAHIYMPKHTLWLSLMKSEKDREEQKGRGEKRADRKGQAKR